MEKNICQKPCQKQSPHFETSVKWTINVATIVIDKEFCEIIVNQLQLLEQLRKERKKIKTTKIYISHKVTQGTQPHSQEKCQWKQKSCRRAAGLTCFVLLFAFCNTFPYPQIYPVPSYGRHFQSVWIGCRFAAFGPYKYIINTYTYIKMQARIRNALCEKGAKRLRGRTWHLGFAVRCFFSSLFFFCFVSFVFFCRNRDISRNQNERPALVAGIHIISSIYLFASLAYICAI